MRKKKRADGKQHRFGTEIGWANKDPKGRQNFYNLGGEKQGDRGEQMEKKRTNIRKPSIQGGVGFRRGKK